MLFPETDSLTHLNRSALRRLGQLKQVSSGILGTLGAAAVSSVVLLSGPLSGQALAAESVTLRFEGTDETFAVEDIARFAATGEAVTPEVRSYFERSPEVSRLVQSIFGAEIYISPEFIANVEAELRSPTADFILIQLSKLISTPTNPERTDALRTAVFSALRDDNRLSLVEILRRYPEANVRVDLTGLETAYNDVAQFVERVLPALEVAKQYLQTIICDCETRTSQADGSQLSSAPGTAVKTSSQPCPVQTSAASAPQTVSVP